MPEKSGFSPTSRKIPRTTRWLTYVWRERRYTFASQPFSLAIWLNVCGVVSAIEALETRQTF